MLCIKTLTLNDLLDRLRELGMSISYEKLVAAVDQGVFAFVHKIKMTQNEYIIFESDFNKWVAEHATNVEMNPAVQEYMNLAKTKKAV